MGGHNSHLVILMADDDEDDCLFAKIAFEEIGRGHDLRFVVDGLELLNYLYNRESYSDPVRFPRPDLILLDLNMPNLDGREALKRIKSDPRLENIPVSILTTSQDERDIHWSKEAGAVAFLSKPGPPDEWTDMLKKLCLSICDTGQQS